MIVLHTILVTATAAAGQTNQNNLNSFNQTGLSNQNWTDNNRKQKHRG